MTKHPFVFISADVYVQRFPKRKDLVPFDISLILVACTIEEAEERIFLHAKNVAQSKSKILVKTINSDFMGIAISV